jgi:hypothetical protein
MPSALLEDLEGHEIPGLDIVSNGKSNPPLIHGRDGRQQEWVGSLTLLP